MISAINFTGKIPIGTSIIKDKKTGEKIPAVCYEYDGKDKEDAVIYEKSSLTSTAFRLHTLSTLQSKIEGDETYKNNHIYTIETKDGKIAANADFVYDRRGAEIRVIGANKQNYGLAGRNLIAHVSKRILDEKPDGEIAVFAPVYEAIPFYTHGCNFYFDSHKNLILDKERADALYEKCGCKNEQK